MFRIFLQHLAFIIKLFHKERENFFDEHFADNEFKEILW